MSNVLGNLFGEIANAIRAKTGGTDTMKPAEFPAEIAAIPTGGGSSSGELKYATGHLTATSEVMTVNHNLGYVPDIMILYAGEVPALKNWMIGIGYSSAMLEALGGGYLSIAQGAGDNGTTTVSADKGVDTDYPGQWYVDFGGGIRSMTSTSFIVGGGSNVHLGIGESYSWIAISGITG